MANLSLQRFEIDGIELLIDTQTGESFASAKGYARMSGRDYDTIKKRCQRGGQVNAEIPTEQGLKWGTLIPEDLICQWLPLDNPEMAAAMLKLGVRVFLHEMAGYKVTSEATNPPRPLIEAELEIELEIEKTKLEIAKVELERERIVSTNDRIIEELRLEQNQIEYAQYSAGKLTGEQIRERLLDDMAAFIDRFVQVKGVMPKVRDLHQKFQSRKIPDEQGNLVKINSTILRSLLPEVLERCECDQESIPSGVTKLRVRVSRTH